MMMTAEIRQSPGIDIDAVFAGGGKPILDRSQTAPTEVPAKMLLDRSRPAQGYCPGICRVKF
jgi:hypothetical protein